MYEDKPVIELAKDPVPVPFNVLLLLVVGLDEVLQQTPFEVIVAPPSLVILPPEMALDAVIEDAEFVLIVGKLILKVLKLT